MCHVKQCIPTAVMCANCRREHWIKTTGLLPPEDREKAETIPLPENSWIGRPTNIFSNDGLPRFRWYGTGGGRRVVYKPITDSDETRFDDDLLVD